MAYPIGFVAAAMKAMALFVMAATVAKNAATARRQTAIAMLALSAAS